MLTKSFWKDTGITFVVAFGATLVLGLTPIVDTATTADAALAAGVALTRTGIIAGLAAVAPKFRALLGK